MEERELTGNKMFEMVKVECEKHFKQLKKRKGVLFFINRDRKLGWYEKGDRKKDGKYVGEIPEHGLNNLIDGPAIDWLSKQAEPRILVSDLLFTGVNYNRTSGGEVGVTTELLADTLKVIATKNILPIPDVEKAKEWVRRFGGREE